MTALLVATLILGSTGYADALARHVVEDRWVDYAAWRASPADRAAVRKYVEALSAVDLFALERDAQIAAWINLYNAVTVNLILEEGPVGSIKDLDAPWTRPRITVGGRELSLDDIEHDILREDFDEPRIHFALNCASVSCPPLTPVLLDAENLDTRLDELTSRALRDTEWLDVSGCPGAYGDGRIRVSKLFDWFEDDFGGDDGVRAFLVRYRPDLRFRLTNGNCALKSMDYDWSLNSPPER